MATENAKADETTELLDADEEQQYGAAGDRSFLKRTFSKLEPGSVRGSVFTLASTAIGAGVLSLPLVIKETGLTLGIILLLAGGALALFSMELLIVTSARTGHKTYSALTANVFGSNMGLFVELSLVVYTWGAIVAYLVVIGNSVNTVLEAFQVTGILGQTNVDLCLITAVVIMPLALLRDVSGLRYASILAVCSMLFVSLAIVYRGVDLASLAGVPHFRFSTKIFSSMTITWFAYTCHVNVFSVYTELQNPLMRRMRKIMWRSTYLELLLYLAVAVFGYLTFHDATPGNILEAYPHSDQLFIIGRICVATSLSAAVALNINPCRMNLEAALFKDSEFSMTRHFVLTLLLVGAALAVAIAAPQVSMVFGLLGASCCVLICYAVPILGYIRVFKEELSPSRQFALRLGLALIVLVGAISISDNLTTMLG